jgi:glycosyltransferase involved in cell wall biosynthesis
VKVLRLITRLNVGGPARQVLALRKEMALLGVDETLVAGCVDEGEADLAEFLNERDIVRVPSLVRPVRPPNDVRAYREIDRLIRRIRPDVVHTHLSKAGMLGRLAALRRGVPVTVHTFHGHVLDAYFSSPVGHLIKASERTLARRTSALLAVGEGVRQDLIDYGVAPADRIRVVPAGIDLSSLAEIGPPGGELRRSLGLPPGARVLGFAGRFVAVKRIDRLIEVARIVLESLPDVHLLACGDGPDRVLLTEAASSPPLAGRTHFLGWRSDLEDFYEAVDVVLLTSANEGTPISLIEAAAAARPVVATPVGGVPDVVEQGSTGFLADTAGAAAEALIELLTQPNLARRMGAAGRERALARYGAARLAADLVPIYQRELVSAGNQTSSLGNVS